MPHAGLMYSILAEDDDCINNQFVLTGNLIPRLPAASLWLVLMNVYACNATYTASGSHRCGQWEDKIHVAHNFNSKVSFTTVITESISAQQRLPRCSQNLPTLFLGAQLFESLHTITLHRTFSPYQKCRCTRLERLSWEAILVTVKLFPKVS